MYKTFTQLTACAIFGAAATRAAATEIQLHPDSLCYDTVGAVVTVDLDLRNAAVPIVGGQFFLAYNAGVLQFVGIDPGDDPFVVEVFDSVPGDGGPNTIDYAVSTVAGAPGTMADTTMARVTFVTLQEVCDVSGLLSFRVHAPPNRLSDFFGSEVTASFVDLPAVSVDETSPIIVCPLDVAVEADESTDPSNTGSPFVSENCPPPFSIEYTDAILPGRCPLASIIQRTWTAVDDCQLEDDCIQLIGVFDTDSDDDGVVDCQEGSAGIHLEYDSDCYGELGAAVTVSIELTDATVPVVGGQFFLEYNTGILQFVSIEPGDAPFVVEIYEAIPGDGGPGTIDYAVSTVSGHPGTIADSTMAVVTFLTLADTCNAEGLVTFRNHDPPNRLSNDVGNEVVATFLDFGSKSVDTMNPTITCPATTVVPPGGSSDPMFTGTATAGDNCDPAPHIEYSDMVVPDVCPITFVIHRTWRATDACGNFVECEQLIGVFDQDTEGDGVLDCEDNCPTIPNHDQANCNEDAEGDACDVPEEQDHDDDGHCNNADNCPDDYNPGQEDTNMDGIGNACCGPCQLFGDIVPQFCLIDVSDLLCVLDDFVDESACPGDADIYGYGDGMPCTPNGLIDVDDIIAVLYAFSGVYLCPVICPPGACIGDFDANAMTPDECRDGNGLGSNFVGDGMSASDCRDLTGGTGIYCGDYTVCGSPNCP